MDNIGKQGGFDPAAWRTVREIGVVFTRLGGTGAQLLAAEWRAPESCGTGDRHLYEIRMRKAGALWHATFLIDGHDVFTLVAGTKSEAENGSLAAARRHLLRSHRRGVRAWRLGNGQTEQRANEPTEQRSNGQ